MKKILLDIAKWNLRIDTLETRNSDSLDFHDIAVWNLREALENAYREGYEAGGGSTVELLCADCGLNLKCK